MSRETNRQIAEGFSQGLNNFVQGLAQRQAAEREKSRVSELAKRLSTASPIEKTAILFEADPTGKTAVAYEVAQEKNRMREEQNRLLEETTRQAFGGSQNVQPVVTGTETPTQPSFSPNAPAMAARNATATNFPGNKSFMGASEEQQAQIPPAATSQPVQGQQQQLTPRQRAQQLRAVGAQMENIRPGAGRAVLDEAKAIEREAMAEKQFSQQEEFAERKANEPYRQRILNGIPQTKKLKAQIGRIEKLSDNAELTPAAVKALNFFGVPIGAFDTENAQELEKLSNDLTATIQSDYGNRILATEFNTFLKRIPTLLNSVEGRKRIIRNMKLYADAAEAEQKAYQNIYKMQKQSGIKHPTVRQEDVMDLVEPELDRIFGELNSELMEDSGTKERAKLLPEVPQGTIRMTKNGKFYDFPAQQIDLRRKEGFAPL